VIRRRPRGTGGESLSAELLDAAGDLGDPARRPHAVLILDRFVGEGSLYAGYVRLSRTLACHGDIPWSNEAAELVEEDSPLHLEWVRAEWRSRLANASSVAQLRRGARGLA
jgi:hypothetical protein